MTEKRKKEKGIEAGKLRRGEEGRKKMENGGWKKEEREGK